MKDSKGWMFWVWLGVIISPVLIECSTKGEVLTQREYREIGPMRPRNTRRDTPPTVTPSWEKSSVNTYSHKDLYHYGKDSGITLRKGNKEIHTGMTSEEIINQLSLDYQDLYDYYGGAEEIF